MFKNNTTYQKLVQSRKPELFSDSEKNEIIQLLLEKNEQLEQLNKTSLESHSKYKSLFEMSDDALLVIEHFNFIDCNNAVVKMLGYTTKEEFLNTHPSALSPEKQPDGKSSFLKAQEMIKLALKNGSNHFEWIHTRANGENFPVEVWLSKVKFEERTLINTIWRDLTDKKKAEQLIIKNIEEKEILLKEIHHRVKNNLQIITSLLNLQASTVENIGVKSILLQSKSRIDSIEIIPKNNHFELFYKDNGCGYSSDINFENTSTLGFQLITSLTEQLNGKIQREFIKHGTSYHLIFKSI